MSITRHGFFCCRFSADALTLSADSVQKLREASTNFKLKKYLCRMSGIYLHIPFCKRRCVYCDFYSTTQSEKREAFVSALCRELELRRDYLPDTRIDTVYFGGGTPSQLTEADFHHIFHALHTHYHIAPDAEITIEANPDDLTETYVTMLRHLPFNRISMGIQTFHEPTLKMLRRRHTANGALEAFARCRAQGFDNISIDLMYGLPGETHQRWADDLQQAIALRPEHISAYHLIYEEDTPLWKLRQERRIREVDEEDSLKFFATLMEELARAGYEHYEISNFCLPGRHSRHNSSYWSGAYYLGCGPSAHSFDGKSRQWNTADLDCYIRHTDTPERIAETEHLDENTRYNESIITGIRTMKGVHLPTLRHTYGETLYRHCLQMAKPHIDGGRLEEADDCLRLTAQGIFLSDGVMSDLLWVD